MRSCVLLHLIPQKWKHPFWHQNFGCLPRFSSLWKYGLFSCIPMVCSNHNAAVLEAEWGTANGSATCRWFLPFRKVSVAICISLSVREDCLFHTSSSKPSKRIYDHKEGIVEFRHLATLFDQNATILFISCQWCNTDINGGNLWKVRTLPSAGFGAKAVQNWRVKCIRQTHCTLCVLETQLSYAQLFPFFVNLR